MRDKLKYMSLTFALWGANQTGFAAQFEQAGVKIDVELTRPGGAQDSNVKASIKVSDASSGAPIMGARPLAWLLPKSSSAFTDEQCKRQMAELVNGGLISRTHLGFNNYRLASFNDDATITIINPQLRLAGTQLESIVQLPGRPTAVAVDAQAQQMLIALAGDARIAMVNLGSRQVEKIFALPSPPIVLHHDPVNNRFWVGMRDGLIIFDGKEEPLRKMAVKGTTRLLALDGLPLIAVAADGDTEVSLIDTSTLQVTRSFKMGSEVVGLAFGSQAKRVYALGRNGKTISLDIETGAQNEARDLAASKRIAFDTQGRFAFAVMENGRMLAVYDSAHDKVIATSPLPEALRSHVDMDLQFSDRYLYLHAKGADSLTLVALDEAHSGKLTMVNIPLGKQITSSSPASALPGLAIVPEGSGAIVEDDGAKGFAFYMEGMMVPAGALQSYGHQALGLMILNRGLKETARGNFEATTVVRSGGKYLMPILIDQPRVVKCLDVSLPGPVPVTSLLPVTWHLKSPREPVVAGNERTLQIETAAPVASHALLISDGTGVWQRHHQMVPLGQNRFQLQLTFPQPGRYHIHLRSDNPPPPLIVDVVSAAKRAGSGSL